MLELLCPIKKNSIDRPNALAIITDNETYTYRQLDHKLDEMISLLKKKGIQSRQRVAFVTKQTPATVFLLFALARMQVAACPISTRLPSQLISERTSLLQAAFFIDVDTLSLTYLDGQTSHPHFDESPLFSLLATSGSNSFPKIVAHSFENFYYSALGSNLSLGLQQKHKWLIYLPLYHVGGIAAIFRAFLTGASIVMSSLPLLHSINIHDISHMSLVPTQLYRLLKEIQGTSLPTIEAILVGGAALPQDLFRKALHKGLKIYPTYGLTEMSAQVTMDHPTSENTELTCGIPLPFRQVKIAEDGEILVRGKTLFHGYWTQDKKLELPLIDGWFATKDIGAWSKDDKLIIKGRKDNMFISGGENIHPEVIEKELCELPGVIQAMVVPTEDQEFGHRPIAFLQQENISYTIEEIREKLKSKLPGYCLPVQVHTIPTEATQNLKVSRKSLLERVAELVR